MVGDGSSPCRGREMWLIEIAFGASVLSVGGYYSFKLWKSRKRPKKIKVPDVQNVKVEVT